MHPEPKSLLDIHGGDQNGALLYGVEYENIHTDAVNKNHNGDAGCVLCQLMNMVIVYVQWVASKDCTNDFPERKQGDARVIYTPGV